jgi:hypothetical protein
MVRLRRQRWTGQQIARATGCSPATVAKHLKRRASSFTSMSQGDDQDRPRQSGP